jgi:hypothetical protein
MLGPKRRRIERLVRMAELARARFGGPCRATSVSVALSGHSGRGALSRRAF